MNLTDILQKLCKIEGISGFEQQGTNEFKDIFKEYFTDVRDDKLGNIIANNPKENAPKVLIEAHCDIIGLMVKGFDDKGFVTVTSIGGIDARILPAKEVVINGKEKIRGVICTKPPHLLSSDDMKKGVKLEQVAIDTGYNADKVKELISIGDPITIVGEPFYTGDMFYSAGLDNRAGIATIISTMQELKDYNLNIDLYALGAVQEEVGRRGAKTGAYGINPDIAIIIDVTHGSTPDGNRERTFSLGKGPAVAVGPNIHPRLYTELLKVAKEQGIPYQIEVESSDTGTDAWAIQIVRSGIPCLLLSIPLRYMHTCTEALNITDIQQTARLIAAFLRSISQNGLEGLLCWEN